MPAASARRQVVLGAAALVVLVQLGFRAWALYPSWFYTDDYRLLVDARSSPLDASYLTRPFDSQFMPFGRLLAWLVQHSGALDWPLAATLTLVLQLLATSACAWMLFTLFGVRRKALLLLVVYATSAITVPALMWWAASLNQLPLQVVFFSSATTWVLHLRTGHRRWLVLLVAIIAFGMLSYVKTVLVLAVLVYLLLGWFCTGSLRNRAREALRRHWGSAVALGGLGVGFVVYYLLAVPQIVGTGTQNPTGGLAGTMLGLSLPVGLVGGPWHWDTRNPPTGYADPPQIAVHLAWVLLAVGLLVVLLRRRRSLPAWGLLGGYVLAAYALVLTTRARVLGDLIGLEYRYLTDVLPVFVLCVGLATMPLLGGRGSSAPRARPLLLVSPGPRWQNALVALVAVSGLLSSVAYVRIWHDDNPGKGYVQAARSSLADKGVVDLADQAVPGDVVPGFSAPYNTTGRLLPLITDRVSFPRTTDDLVVLGGDGTAYRALIDAAATSIKGPNGSCGWNVGRTPRTIPMDHTTYDYTWWIRIGYLAGGRSRIRVAAGDDVVEAPLRQGLHSLYLRVSGAVSSLTVSSLSDPGLCVDTAEVGRPVPGSPL